MTQPEHLNRRKFLKTTAAASAAASVAGPLFIPKHVFGANDRIRVAVLGVHGRGKSHIRGFMALDNVEVTTLCDPDMQVLQEERIIQGNELIVLFCEVWNSLQKFQCSRSLFPVVLQQEFLLLSPRRSVFRRKKGIVWKQLQ